MLTSHNAKDQDASEEELQEGDSILLDGLRSFRNWYESSSIDLVFYDMLMRHDLQVVPPLLTLCAARKF